ncbi:hypothetical protein Pyrde_1760 [Pyrodictium delaneyi]|uniref:Uncharacterized protein n=1 Tax=Pyrodictium delaneyi TaxID=1273541 RepID=A0A0P0N4G6_9CREN|nr:hypothetical protein Pyrde_1760 [Pyrodictium delaneyi]OWJ54981.1 hypothetical protein Pdsh_04615 [Pyrodictium delaneyi]
MAGEGYVLLLGPMSIVELLSLRGKYEPLEVYRRALEGRAEGVELLRQALENGSVRKIVYLGVDGALPRLLGQDHIIDLYGSLPRLRCPRCGRKWWLEEGTVCPNCGIKGERDSWETPRSRLLSEAVYELTTAEIVAVHGLGEPPIALGAVLAISVSRFTRVMFLEPVPRQLQGLGLEEPGKKLLEMLQELVSG